MSLYRTLIGVDFMSENIKSDNEKLEGYALTSESLKDDVLDHLMSNMSLYFGEESIDAERFIAIANALNTFSHDIAKKSIANRQNLSPLKTFSSTISADPDTAETVDQTAHQLRYRLVEQYPGKEPHKDDLFTLAEAIDIYGEVFVSKYWGELGEHCPRKIQTSDERLLWFTTVRFPDQAMSVTQGSELSNARKLDDALKL